MENVKKARVVVEGLVPLIHHNPKNLLEKDQDKKIQVGKVQENVEEYLYFDEEIGVYQPAEHLEASMVNAAKNFKIPGKGKKTYADIVKAYLLIEPRKIPLNSSWKPFTTTVVIKNNRILRTRPMFDKWSLTFNVVTLDNQVLPLNVI